MGLVDQLPLVCEGIYLYADAVPVRVRIVASPETLGTGDYEDEEATAENQDTPCFFVLYEMAGEPGEFRNVVPNLHTLEAAYKFCEEKFPNIRWQSNLSAS
jgi:hypothetical protein